MVVLPGQAAEHTDEMTVEAFWEQFAGKPVEVVYGKVVEVRLAGGESPEVGLIIGAMILQFPPDLAVGVVSSTDNPADVQAKVDLYPAGGVELVWVVYPDTRRVSIYHHGGRYESLSIEDTLSGGHVLPGFELKVADCFPSPPPEQKSEQKTSE